MGNTPPPLNTRSQRLNWWLDNDIDKSWPPLNEGRAGAISEACGISLTMGRKYIKENALPRLASDKIRISKILNIPPIYWEYGLDSQEIKLPLILANDHTAIMEFTMAIDKISIESFNLRIEDPAIMSLMVTLAIDYANAVHNRKPDQPFITNLINILNLYRSSTVEMSPFAENTI